MPLLQDMTWPRAAAAFQRSDLVVVPIGSTEQHGPHLPLSTDFLVAQHIAERVGDALDAIVAPVLPFGYAPYHMDFAGTVTLDDATLRAAILHTCLSLMRHGARRFIVVNGHGGNTASAESVAMELSGRGALCAVSQWWELARELNPSWPDFSHAGIAETSMVLAIDPAAADMSAARAIELKPLSENVRSQYASRFQFGRGTISVRMPMSRITPSGNLGEIDPSGASAELGREIIEAVVAFLVEFGKEFKTVPLGG